MPPGTEQALLGFSLVASAIGLAILLQSILFPASRVWPVPADGRRLRWFRVLLSRAVGPVIGLSMASMLGLAFADFGSMNLSTSLHVALGALLFIAGGALGWSGFRTLGPEISTGSPGELVVRGPYRFSRNPQYVGAVGVLAGIAMLSNSVTVVVAALPWCVWFLLAPIAEEPWLETLLGEPYAAYAARTRRYL